MIEITNRQLVTTPILQVMQKLGQMSVFDGKTAYRIHKIGGKIVEHYNSSLKSFNALGDALGKKDENGVVLKNQLGHHIPEEGKQDAYAVELEEFMAAKYEIPVHKLNVFALDTRFSPQEIAALEPLLDGLEEDESAKAPLALV